MDSRQNIILTVNIVEPGLVDAVEKHSAILGRKLTGLVLINTDYENDPHRIRDESGLFKEIVCNFNDTDELQTVIKPYMDRILAVTCRSEAAIHSFRQLIPFLPYINTPSESSLWWSSEKHLMRDRIFNYDNTLVPRYQYMEKNDMPKLATLMENFPFPVIVKPSGLAESLLVSRCETYIELRRRLEYTFKVIDDIYIREHRNFQSSVLIEEIMEGEMYSTDAYVTRTGGVYCLPLVKVITAHSIGLPGYYSYRHIIPVGVSNREVEGAYAASTAAIKALNLSSTSTHIELFHTSNGWKIIEVGARIGGYREDLYREAYGVDHYYNDLAVRMGLKPEMPGQPIGHTAGINIYAEEEGYIESIEGMEEAKKLNSVVYLNSSAKPGDLALYAGNGGHLIIDGILSNKDANQLEQDVASVRKLINIKIRKDNRIYPLPIQL